MSDIDTGVVVSLKVLDPDGRLEKRTKSGHRGMSALCQKRTHAVPQNVSYSITSSARPSSGSGTAMPTALAALKLRNISTLVPC